MKFPLFTEILPDLDRFMPDHVRCLQIFPTLSPKPSCLLRLYRRDEVNGPFYDDLVRCLEKARWKLLDFKVTLMKDEL